MRLKSTTTAAIAMITLLVCGAALLSSINARALQQGEGPDAAGERGPGPGTHPGFGSNAVLGHITQVTRGSVGGLDVVVRVPRATPPTGVLLVLHGCSHGAYDWASPSECDGCVGLPEEMTIARHAAEAGLVLAAPSSSNRERKCWRPGDDGPRLVHVVESLTQQHPGVPLFVFGASSGGAMALVLPRYVPDINAIVAQIMALPSSALSTVIESLSGKKYPPTLFLHMARDEHTSARVDENKKVLSENGVPVHSLTLSPAKVTAKYIGAKLGIPSTAAQIIVARLTSAGVLTDEGELVEDPRMSDWRDAVHGLTELGGDTLVPDSSPLSEVLNVAWAMHEIFSDADDAMFKWFNRIHQGSVGGPP